MKDQPTLAVLGCGNMGGAILTAVLAAKSPAVGRAIACDPDEAKRGSFTGAEPMENVVKAISEADVVLLATKPQVMADAIAPLRELANGKLFVSIAAGVTGDFLAERLPGGRIVRTMPNTPVLVGRGVVAIARGPGATEADIDWVLHRLFASSVTVEVDAMQMNAVTAVSGSGPAYFFAIVEALAAAGERAGLGADEAMLLARQTFVGAAALLDSPMGDTPAELRRRVTSPGGTTAAALQAFAAGGLQKLVDDAVTAAAERGAELEAA